MKKKNKGNKKLAAMGAVVAAGLTPGMIAGEPVPSPQPDAEITAAQVVAIDGNTYSFDQLYAMQPQHKRGYKQPQHATKYGVPLTEIIEQKDETDSIEVFRSVEQMPQFPGGEAALMKYIKSHINYPPMAAMNNIEGIVVVQMVIDKNGKVDKVKVIRSIDKDIDKEAVRVCKSLPKFTPGRQNGKAVAVWYTLPVTFKLQHNNAGQD